MMKKVSGNPSARLQDDYELAFAEDAKTTLRILKNQTFDLCLLDIMLPDGSGIDLLRQIKRRDDTLDVIMVTALTGVDTALEAMKLGAYDYITKPYKSTSSMNLSSGFSRKGIWKRKIDSFAGASSAQTGQPRGDSKPLRKF